MTCWHLEPGPATFTSRWQVAVSLRVVCDAWFPSVIDGCVSEQSVGRGNHRHVIAVSRALMLPVLGQCQTTQKLRSTSPPSRKLG
jgi:hypothetical protein